MPWYDKTTQNMEPKVKYSRQQLVSMLREAKPSLNNGSYQWAVGGMLKSGGITRTGFGEYMVKEGDVLPEYQPVYSELSNELLNKVTVKFPYIKFTIFETVLLNEFLNHLVAQNTIFIQLEKDTSVFVFRFLQEAGYMNVMYKPSKKNFNLYWASNCIIVTDMVSEAPRSANHPHIITMEKMLVDIYCDKLIRSTYSVAEYASVVEQAMKTYRVERSKILRYARRRNRAAEIKQIMVELE